LLQPAPTPTSTFAPTVPPTLTLAPTDTLVPTPIVYDGKWSGQTKTGWPVTLEIVNNTIVKFSFQFGTASCNSKTEYDIKNDTRENKPTMHDGSFEFGTDGPSFSYQFKGTFVSATDVTGTLKATNAQCGSTDTTWEATLNP